MLVISLLFFFKLEQQRDVGVTQSIKDVKGSNSSKSLLENKATLDITIGLTQAIEVQGRQNSCEV